MLNENLQNFLYNIKQPCGILFYRLVWAQLGDIKNLKVLDFGSGFGVTANYLAEYNEVIAIEPNADMIEYREQENNYTQINGKIEKLKDFADGSFDVVVCHNVLQFAEERAEIVKELSRLLKSGGILSITAHNKTGRIMFTVVFENNIDAAVNFLDSGEASAVFGKINYFDPEDLVKWGDDLKIEKILGARIFGALQQNNDIKYEPGWVDKMFEIEKKVCDLEPYKSIAFIHHVLVRKL